MKNQLKQVTKIRGFHLGPYKGIASVFDNDPCSSDLCWNKPYVSGTLGGKRSVKSHLNLQKNFAEFIMKKLVIKLFH